MKKIILFLALLLFLSPVHAEEPVRGSIQKAGMTFSEAYQIMLVNNNALKALDSGIQKAKYEKYSARGKFFPKVGVGATYARLNDHINLPLGRIGDIEIQQENMAMLNAGAVWNIFTGGKIIALNKAANAKFEGSNAKLKEVKCSLTSELVKRYFALRLAIDVLEVRAQAKEGMQKHYNDALKLEEAGVIAKSQTLRAQVAYSNAMRDYNTSKHDVLIYEEGLKNLIKEDNVDLENINLIPTSSLFISNSQIQEYAAMKNVALLKNPSLEQMKVKKELAKQNYRIQAAQYSPTVSLFAYNNLASKDLSWAVPKWAAGASVNFEVFDGFSRYNDLRAADAYKKQVQYEEVGAKIDVESLVNKKYQEFLKFEEQYKATEKSIEAAEESLRVSDLSFREGYSTSLEVVDAQLALSFAKIERLNAVYNYDVALAELLATVGESEKFLEYLENSNNENL